MLESKGTVRRWCYRFESEYGSRRLFKKAEPALDAKYASLPRGLPFPDGWYIEVTLTKSPRFNPGGRWPDEYAGIEVRYVT